MNCARLRQVLDARLDAELDAATAEEADRHLAACSACAALRDERLALRAAIRAEVPRHAAPASVHRAVRGALAAEGRRRARGPSWWHASAFAAAAAVAGLAAGLWLAQPPRDHAIPEQVVATHVASLAPGRALTDLASDDRHAIKPWFVGKVDFAPMVRDLRAEGFALVGARLDHVGDRQASAVLYRVRNHYVSLFAWRTDPAAREPVRLATARGFGVATWSDGGLRFAAVSDVDLRDLERFARLAAAP